MRYTSRPRKSPRQSLFGQRDAHGRRRLSKFEVLEGRELLTASPLSNWQNADNPRDVNNDGRVSALDAVLVISHLLNHGTRDVPSASQSMSPLSATGATTSSTPPKVNYLDVNGDNRVSALDAVKVISYLLAPPEVEFSVRFVQTDGVTPIANDTVNVNDKFLLEVDVRDVRSPAGANYGLAAAYVNVNYDPAHVSISSTATPDFGDTFFPYGPDLEPDIEYNLDSTNGLIFETGSFTNFSPLPGPPNSQVLFQIEVTATAAGLATFTPSEDLNPFHDNLFFPGAGEEAAAQGVSIIPRTLTVVGGSSDPTVSVADVKKAEGPLGPTPFEFVATLSSPATSQIILGYETIDGTATGGGPAPQPGEDYISVPQGAGRVTFAPGDTQRSIFITVNGDNTDEINAETFSLRLFSIGQGNINTAGSDLTALGTILNDDGTPTIKVDDVEVVGRPIWASSPADDIPAVFTFTLSTTLAVDVGISWGTQNGTATAGLPNEGGDYGQQDTDIVTIPAGTKSVTVTVPVYGQVGQQPDEFFQVELTSLPAEISAAGSDTVGVGTIVRQGLEIQDLIQPEDTGPFVVQVDLPLHSDDPNVVTVNFTTVDIPGGARSTAGANPGEEQDYVPTSGVLTFLANQTVAFITVNVLPDTKVEADEQFRIDLDINSAVNAAVLDSSATITIDNDEGQKASVQLKVVNPDGSDPGSNLREGQFYYLQVFVSDLENPATGIFQAYMDVLYDNDLVQLTGPVLFADRFKAFSDPGNNNVGEIDEVGAASLNPPDPLIQPELFFIVSFRANNPGIAHFSTNEADETEAHFFQTYQDDPIPPGQGLIDFGQLDVTIGGNVVTATAPAPQQEKVSTMVFTVTWLLPNSQQSQAVVTYTTKDGTAVAGGSQPDYVTKAGTLTFTHAHTVELVTVQVLNDDIYESDESFTLVLSGADASATPATGTILDDDAVPGLRIQPDPAAPDTFEGQPARFIVTRENLGVEGPGSKVLTVNYRTITSPGDTATPGADYTPTTGTLTFQLDDTRKTITIPTLGDQITESPETFHVELFNARFVDPDPNQPQIPGQPAQGRIIDVPPVAIEGDVFIDSKPTGGQPDGIKGFDSSGHPEIGIPNVIVKAINEANGAVTTTTTDANGHYRLILSAGTYTVVETQPGFYDDGLDRHNGQPSNGNDRYTGVQLGAPNPGVAAGYNFGEGTLRTEFVPFFLTRRALFSTAVVSGANTGPAQGTVSLNPAAGDLWISFDGGWAGLRTITALFDPTQGSATMQLFANDNLKTPIATSAPTVNGAQLAYSGVEGSPYFLRIFGTSRNVTLAIDPPLMSSAGPLSAFVPAAMTSSAQTSAPANSDPPMLPASSTQSAPVTRDSLLSTAQVSPSSSATDTAMASDSDWLADALAG
jgi:hypothetical protein